MIEEVIKYLIKNPHTTKQKLWDLFPNYSKNHITSTINQFIDFMRITRDIDLTPLLGFLDLFNKFISKEIKEACIEKEYIERENEKLSNYIETCYSNLKECASPIEQILYLGCLYHNLGIEREYDHLILIPQVEIGEYRIDFEVENYRKKIGIECDGKKYHDNYDKERSTEKTNYDYDRELYLKREGWEIIHFTGSQIYNNVLKCIKQIEDIKEYGK